MRCPKVLRWLCGNWGQRRSVRSTIDQLNEQTAANLEATRRLRRDPITSAVMGTTPRPRQQGSGE
jgi:hypothetical protein